MKFEGFKMFGFDQETVPEKMHTVVPFGSVLLDFKILHDGVYTYYETPSIVTSETRTDTFTILNGENMNVPENGKFKALLEHIYEGENEEQKIVLFPIYQIIP